MRAHTAAGAALALSFILPLLGTSAGAQPQTKPPGDVNWQHFRFDNNHTGFQPFETTLSKDNIGQAEISWEAALGGSDSVVDFSSPAVVNGVVYLGTDDGHLFAYPANGCGQDGCFTPLWESTTIPQMIDSPAVANGIVYIGSQTSQSSAAGKLNAFAADGCGEAICKPLWQGDAGPDSIIDSSPAVWKGSVFVGAKDLYAFNAEGCGKRLCKPVWTGKLAVDTLSSPVIYKGVVYIGDGDGKLYAFNAAGCGQSSCKPLWIADFAGSSFDYGSSPSISGGVVYIASFDRLSAFDANGCGKARCKPLWQGVPKFGEGDGFIFGGSPAIANGNVYIPSSEDSYGVAVYPAKGCGQATCVWSSFLRGPGFQSGIESSPTIANGVVYAGRNTGEVLAWADSCAGECDPLWVGQTAFGQIVNASPTIVNGKIYVGSSDASEDGILYVYGLPH